MHAWIEGAKRGDAAACENIVRQFTGMALAVAYEKLRDAHLAEDAVQEAFAEAFMNVRKLREPAAFPGWFKVIVERQCHRIMRRKQFRTIPIQEIEQVAGETDPLATIVARREMLQRLHASIADLSTNMRLAVQLFYFQGYSIREISSCLRVSASTLKKRLFDARRKLKHTLPVADLISVFNDLYEGGEAMLHIVNGDSVGDKLKQGTVQGDVLVWREIYPAGPIFSDLTVPGNRSIRARYLEQTMGIPQAEYLKISETQERELQEFRKYKEIVLWFEHDLFDQTMLCYLLHWFAKQPLGETRLSLLCIGAYPGIELFRGLGQLSARQLEALSGTWHAVEHQELELGSRIWEAYASPDIGQLTRVLQEDTTALPFVQAAFEAHLSRLPSAHNGLGIVEQITLETIAGGVNKPYALFDQVGGKLHMLGMGDLEYWYRLKRMSEEPYQLLHVGGSAAFPDFKSHEPPFRDCVIALTELGRAVLAGDKDWAALKGTDDWLGGYRLEGRSTWRWDAACKSIVWHRQGSL